MAGTLIVDEIKSGTTAPPVVKNTNGVAVGEFCRARVNFNGTGTVAARDSFNVSSLTDNGTGDYSLGLTVAMADVSYSVTVSCKEVDSTTRAGGLAPNPFSYAVGGVRLHTTNVAGTAVDSALVCCAVFGD